MTLDVFTGKSANWDNRAIQIIEYLLKVGSDTYTYAEIARALDIPTVEVSRYLREESYERRPREWFEDMRKHRPVAYKHYLMNHRVTEDEDGMPQWYVNLSKHNIFLMNCRLKHAEVLYRKNKQGRKMVYLFEGDYGQTDPQYLKAEMEWDDLYDNDDSEDYDHS